MLTDKAVIIALFFLIIACICYLTDVKREYSLIWMGLYSFIAIFIALV